MNSLSFTPSTVLSYSAGSQPDGEINPVTLQLPMQTHRPINGLGSKLRDEIELLPSPPLASLDRIALQKEATHIGKSST